MAGKTTAGEDGSGTGRGGNDFKQKGWGVVIPRGRNDLFEAIKPLVDLRQKDCASKIKSLVVTEAQDISKSCKDWPKYLLLLGGVDEIPFDVQRELVLMGKYVGRLVFPDERGYTTYANNVVTWEKSDEKKRNAVSDFGCVVVTDSSKIVFYHKNFGDTQESPFANWSVDGDMHPMQLIQQALNRQNKPFPILARVPLQWLERSPLPVDLHAKNLQWSSLDFEKDEALWPKSFHHAVKQPENLCLGGVLLGFSDDVDLEGNMKREIEKDGKRGAEPFFGNLVLGDPVIQLGAVAGNAAALYGKQASGAQVEDVPVEPRKAAAAKKRRPVGKTR